ncbi:choline transporter-like protein 4 isoform X3 [Branchiostoma floridae]|uniref:Choline transporter-like protein n=1 Tax=Branchiostoma floridae TaxID=7739 RepID=A0A9J7LKT8_BRAFL|nr:choline transporter-like protein 4 isoform X3 [Branchiostoma floridae]
MGKDNEGEEKKYGDPAKFDPEFKGPIENRSCTDIICCLLFIIFIAGFLAVGILAWVHGDPKLLLYPTDSQGNLCGNGNYASKPNLHFFNLLDCAGFASVLDGCPTPQVCVAACPTEYWAFAVELVKMTAGGQADYDKFICTNDVNITGATAAQIEQYVKDQKCAAYTVPSKAYGGRCIPSLVETIATTVLTTSADDIPLVDSAGNNVTNSKISAGTAALALILSAQEVVQEIFTDMVSSWYLILGGLGAAMVVSFIYIVIMRWIAGVMVWFTIFAVIVLNIFGIYYCYTQYVALENVSGADSSIYDVGFTTNLSTYTKLQDTWLGIGIALSVILLIILLILIFLRNRIRIAIALIKESSRAVSNIMSTLFFPLIPWILQLILFAYWGAVALFLASSGQAQYEVQDYNTTNTSTASNMTGQSCTPTTFDTNAVSDSVQCAFVKYGATSLYYQNLFYLQIFNLFGLFWVMNFIVALGQCTLAGAFASYYWAFTKPKDIPTFPLTASFGRSLRYHLGSLAFGSFIIAVVQIIRVMLEYIDHKLKDSENRAAKFLLKCLKCCFWCLEKLLKFLNKNAYIMIAIYGKNFCVSAKKAFFLIMRNILRVAAVTSVTNFLFLLSKLVVTGAIGTLSFYFFTGKIVFAAEYVPNLKYYMVPIIVVVIGAYMVAACFFSVYNMAVDTLFLCFLEDLERNDGSPEKPYYMSKELMSILGKKNRKEGEKEKKGCCGCC